MNLDCLLDLRGNGQAVDYVYLWGALFMIPAVSLLMCIIYFVFEAIRQQRRKKWGKEAKKLHPKMLIPVLCISIFVTHPIATQYFLSVFDCGKNNPGTSLQYDTERFLTNMDVDCTSEEHMSMQNSAITGIVVISFG